MSDPYGSSVAPISSVALACGPAAFVEAHTTRLWPRRASPPANTRHAGAVLAVLGLPLLRASTSTLNPEQRLFGPEKAHG